MPELKEKTAFKTSSANWQYWVLPFGRILGWCSHPLGAVGRPPGPSPEGAV